MRATTIPPRSSFRFDECIYTYIYMQTVVGALSYTHIYTCSTLWPFYRSVARGFTRLPQLTTLPVKSSPGGWVRSLARVNFSFEFFFIFSSSPSLTHTYIYMYHVLSRFFFHLKESAKVPEKQNKIKCQKYKSRKKKYSRVIILCFVYFIFIFYISIYTSNIMHLNFYNLPHWLERKKKINGKKIHGENYFTCTYIFITFVLKIFAYIRV